ncbi:MAG: outer membrane protein assembly factor BamB family protein, partial [Acidimicrobiales bacterium]
MDVEVAVRGGRTRRAVLLLAGAVLGLPAAAVAGAGASVPAPRATGLTVTLQWADLLGAGSAIVESSPTVATLDGSGPSVVVGSRLNGCVYAVHLADGSSTPGWGHQCTGHGIDSTPSVLAAGGGLDDVVVTTGDVSGLSPSALDPGHGAVFEFAPPGNTIWSRTLPDVFGTFGADPAVPASPAVGDTGTGQARIVVGDVGLSLYSLDPATGATVAGWPQKTADTTFATAAIANVDGTQSVLAASDSSAGPGALDNWNGGSVRLMGAGGSTAWTDASDEVVSSGPVVGDLNGNGPIAVYGHGQYWNGTDEDGLTAVNAANGAKVWEQHLGGYTLAAPSLADLGGTGQLDVIEPSWRTVGQGTGGTVFAFDPAGNRLWSFAPQSATTIAGSVSTADFGEGYQDVVAATGLGFYIIDGKSGAAAAPVQGLGLNSGFAGDPNPGNLNMQNAPLVVPDPSGVGLDVVVAGTYGAVNNDNTQGFIAPTTSPTAPARRARWAPARGPSTSTTPSSPAPPSPPPRRRGRACPTCPRARPRGTCWPPPTAACSATATRATTARSPAPVWTSATWWASRAAPMAAGTGWSAPTAACSPSET